MPESTLSRAGSAAAPLGRGRTRTIWWSDTPTDARVVSLADLPPGEPSRGPLVILDGESVSVVPPDWAVRPEPGGALLWERAT
jgi:N-methylhydantoinase A/oxoprolinase/acetone carboxylase beta subunit